MADIKISDMDPWVGAVTGNVEFPAVYANQNYRVALSQLTTSTFGFGSMALQNSNTVSITGGNVAVSALSGEITIANGGTGLGTTPTNGQLLIGNGTDYTLATLTAGSGIGITNTAGGIEIAVTTLSGGTVTSVELDPGTTGLTVSGTNPITTSGTFTLGGTLAVSHGGSGQSTYTNGQLLIGNTTGNTLSKATLTAGSNITITNGPGTITIDAADQYVGTVTSVSALTIGTAGTDLTSTVANGTTTPVITLNVPTASATNRGALSATDWTAFNSKQAALSAGTGISLAGNTVTNTAPDQVVALTAGTNVTITGSYPNFTIAAAGGGGGSGTVTSVDASGGTTGMTFSGGPITNTGTLTLSGTLAVANGGTGATTAAGARANLSAAILGTNNDITSMTAITGGISTPDFIQLDVAPAAQTLVPGKLWWDASGTLNIGMGNGNITQQVGEEFFAYGKATAAITEGQLIYVTGAVGASGVVTFAPTIAAMMDPTALLGVATENIALNGFGRVTIMGSVHGIDTTGTSSGEVWADGDVLWYNPAGGGLMTKVKPTAPNQKTQVAIVTNAGTGGSGSLSVNVIYGSTLGGTDSNVQFASLANNDAIIYNGSTSRWENYAPAAARAALGAGTVTSVDVSGGTTGLTTSGGPVTGAGTVTLAGTLAVANGGTGATTLTGIVKGNGTGAFTAVTAPAGTIVGTTDAQTLTNKRITSRVNAQTTTASPWAWNSDSYDQQSLSALANALTINADAGTPTDGQKTMLRFKDDGTARALTWTTGATNAFRAIGVTLPTTTVISKTVYVGCVYNAADSRWDVVAVAQEA